MQNLRIGDRHLITTESYSGYATVRNFFPIINGDKKGNIVAYDIENYADAVVFFVPDNIIMQSAVDDRRDRSYMPKEYMSKTGRDFNWDIYGEDTSMQKKIVNAFVEKFGNFLKTGKGLYIYSATKGSGKTMLACCLANEVLKRRDIKVKFTSVIEYIELVRDKSEIARDKMHEILDATLLIVDDIGATIEDKEWISNSIFRLVNRRYENILPTIYTSNVPIEKLKCGDRVVSRITEQSIALVMPEKSIRKEKAERYNEEFLRSLFNE